MPRSAPNPAPSFQANLSQEHFDAIRKLVDLRAGIQLRDDGEGMVRARLSPRLVALGMQTYAQYQQRLEEDSHEVDVLIDLLSTNVTSFFREKHHFDYLRDKIVPRCIERGLEKGGIRIWSAGCSMGQEPHSMAITLAEAIPEAFFTTGLILGTDISRRALAVGRMGRYKAQEIRDVSPAVKHKWFQPIEGHPDVVEVDKRLRARVRLRRLNLHGPWPMRGPFDAIFCRNVMIYFDAEARARLVMRFAEALRVGGALFLGHSESLMGKTFGLTFVAPTVYERRS